MKRVLALCSCCLLMLLPAAAEKTYKLNDALAAVAKDVTGKLPARTKVVLVGIEADDQAASDYIIEDLTYELLQTGNVVVVDRQNIVAIRQELAFQMSGDVSDDSAQRLGAMLGAETIITGSFELLGSKYRLSIKAVKVETSEIQYLSHCTVKLSDETEVLFGRKTGSAKAVDSLGKAGLGVLDFTGRLLASSVNPVVGIGSYMQGDIKGGKKVLFWEVAGCAAVVYGSSLDEDGDKNGTMVMGIGACMFGGAVIYSFVRPWVYNRNPGVARVLDNVRVSPTSHESVSAGYVIRY